MYAARISCACAVRQVFVRRVGAAVLVRLRFSSAVRSLNLAIHALRLRSQNMLCSQSRERLLFNRFSLLLFAVSYYVGYNACWTYTMLFSYLGR